MPPGLSSAMTMKRIHREIADLKREDLGPIVLEPNEKNLNIWKGSIPGPQGSVYEGGMFDVEIVLPSDYPFSAPKVLFKTRIYHMNISEQGNICIDILKQNWSPALSLFKVMLSLSSLLTDPNPKDPLGAFSMLLNTEPATDNYFFLTSSNPFIIFLNYLFAHLLDAYILGFSDPVPSIATQYMKSRKQHDATARQWTQTYARPKPPPPPVAAQMPASPKSSKAKGKKRAEPGPPDGAGNSSSADRSTRSTAASAGSSAQDSVIVLDSDDDWRWDRLQGGQGMGRARNGNEMTAPHGAQLLRRVKWWICWIQTRKEKLQLRRLGLITRRTGPTEIQAQEAAGGL
ncbi:ubiquitin-conjugating enzyme/RWD-like protein [Flammula alnicola]|nr:ubiquitin-conjugating enzyme/RWD-like protein [Flammula alnicola]